MFRPTYEEPVCVFVIAARWHTSRMRGEGGVVFAGFLDILSIVMQDSLILMIYSGVN